MRDAERLRNAATLSAVALLVGGPLATHAAPAPRRIVSQNLCADPLLLDLADPGQIAALSPFARDPQLSAVASRAARFPISDGGGEEVLALKPGLVLSSGPRRTATRMLLARHGVQVVDVPYQDSLAEIDQAIMVVANAVGHPQRGRAEIAALDARLAAIGPPPGRGRVAAYYQRRGYLTGTGTLIDELFRRVGLVNLAQRLNRPVLSHVSVEEMAMARPDFLVMESATRRVTDQGVEMLHHPVLERAVPAAHRLYLPQAMTVCGGPVYAEAVALLAQEIAAADAADAGDRSPPAHSPPAR